MRRAAFKACAMAIVVAGVFATITGVSSALIGELGDPEGASNIGALIPFFMMVLMAKGFIIATPFIVRAISGNIMMPALSGGLGTGQHERELPEVEVRREVEQEVARGLRVVLRAVELVRVAPGGARL